jgi:hypothetical protein
MFADTKIFLFYEDAMICPITLTITITNKIQTDQVYKHDKDVNYNPIDTTTPSAVE